jgi:SAM-dependent methyltransferase
MMNKLKEGINIYAELEKRIRKYPRFLRDYYFYSVKVRDEEVKSFYSTIPSNSIILEGACGKMSKLRKTNSDIRTLVGMDLSIDDIKLNNDLDFKIVANLENLPFKRDCFDVVNLPNVVEHLQDPEKVFKEATYVLRKRGFLLVSTKNIYCPFMSIQRLLPLKIRYWIKKNVLKSPGHHLDTFPAPYRCNSPATIKKVLANLGYNEEQIWLFGWPLIITPSIGLFFSMIYEKLTDKKWLLILKPNMWVRFRKI